MNCYEDASYGFFINNYYICIYLKIASSHTMKQFKAWSRKLLPFSILFIMHLGALGYKYALSTM